MSDQEFEVMDELYFVVSFNVLFTALSIGEQELKDCLGGLIAKGWVKCFKTVSEEILVSELNFENQYREYYYLATKEGLLAHNSV